jgi:predicted metal-dependent hydrolase
VAVQLDLPFLRADPATGPLQVDFIRARRARRYILRVRPDGTVRVTIPRGGSRREAEEFLFRQRRWVERERLRVVRQYAPAVWREGDEILLRGAHVTLALVSSGAGTWLCYGDRRIPCSSPAVDLRPLVEADLREIARRELTPRLTELAAANGLRVARITIRNQRSRWGSCSRNGAIALNFRLVQAPPDVRDYVLLHELTHLRQQNHSRVFWRLVEQVCPRFRDAERWLRSEGKSLF